MSEVDVTRENEHVVRTTHVPNLVGDLRVSWGAIFAGVVTVLSVSWLLQLLGTALGVSIADATDLSSMEGGLAVGATLWVLLSWILAFFLGALTAARFAGIIDDTLGMLHGFAMWSVTTILVVVLTAMGVSNLLETGQSIVSSASRGIVSSGESIAQTATAGGDAISIVTQSLSTEFGAQVRKQLTDRAVEIAANSNEQLSEQQIRQAVDSLDERTLRRLVLDLTNDDQEGAAQLLADSTDLSQQDAEALIDGAYTELEEHFGNPDNDQPLSEDLKNQLGQQVDGYVASLDAEGGPEVTAEDVRNAVDRLDDQAIGEIAYALADGDVAGAKRVLVQNSNLSRDQINDLYEGIRTDLEEQAEEFKTRVDSAIETISTYTAQVLWIIFSGSALALAVSLAGGWIGADCTRRFQVRD
ncbi:hypothetical protein KOR42_06550 [Thalassoglobus neptunius]|uniref:Uncharacterized protein n=1 Tax=Thalassoglobus neptunius TaxID=1938619 RepID=A0A5C5X2W9_9PLAN|nr:hypothetical protein [Thalassoglobus neptunius]TWT57296.1 hypothetical protein KOR42_06550 [Thalassoglobus neptunius]